MPVSRQLIAVVIVLALLGGCAAAPKRDSRSTLFGDNGVSFWTLTSFADGPQNADAIFYFEGQLLSLDIPCYRRSWAYEYYEGGGMRFSNPAVWMWCKDDMPPIVEAFDSTIPKVRVSRVNGDVLSLLDGNGRALFVLKRLIATGLENRKWYISSFFDGNALVATRERFSFPFSSRVTFIHGGLDGSPGCGGFMAHYLMSGQQLTIWASYVLGGWCPRGEMESSGVVCKALSGKRSVEQDGDRLILRDDQGRVQIVLTPWEKREL